MDLLILGAIIALSVFAVEAYYVFREKDEKNPYCVTMLIGVLIITFSIFFVPHHTCFDVVCPSWIAYRAIKNNVAIGAVGLIVIVLSMYGLLRKEYAKNKL